MQNRIEFSNGIFSVKVDGRELDKALNGTCKIVTKDHVIYDRKWLEDNLEQEVDLIKRHKTWRNNNAKSLDKSKDRNEKCESCPKKDKCEIHKNEIKIIDKLNEVGNPNIISLDEFKKAKEN